MNDRVRQRLRRRWFPWAVVGVLAAAAPLAGVLAWLATAAEYRAAPPPCYGIGWGCSLSPADAGLFSGILWLATVAAIAVLLAATEFFWRRVASARSVALLVVLGLAIGLLLMMVGQGLFALV